MNETFREMKSKNIKIARAISYHNFLFRFNEELRPLTDGITIKIDIPFESTDINTTPISYFEVTVIEAGNREK